jgi:hypothetical protein
MTWLDEAAAALEVEPLGRRESADVLNAGREVAHAVERRLTPLAAFLVGASVQRRIDAGMAREEAFAQALAALRAVIPTETAPPVGPDRSGPDRSGPDRGGQDRGGQERSSKSTLDE